ncbi:MAG: DUF2917 domain-containing protein [Pseudomonadota bacterium]
MRATLSDHTYHLTPHQLLRLERVRGWQIECLHGQLWITCQGDHVDHVLQADTRLALVTGGMVLVEAVLPGRVRLIAPGVHIIADTAPKRFLGFILFKEKT